MTSMTIIDKLNRAGLAYNVIDMTNEAKKVAGWNSAVQFYVRPMYPHGAATTFTNINNARTICSIRAECQKARYVSLKQALDHASEFGERSAIARPRAAQEEQK